MAVRRSHPEMGGFKLLQEDALDDRPCPEVKKFVSSVLDRKDMKDQEIASSFRNLMEYRDSTSSPSACSVGTSCSAQDRLHSPSSPCSPSMLAGPMDDQRLPNELLDEICEDIGMKEGMELDFVEYLMEQDSDPHLYLRQEAISSSGTSFSACLPVSGTNVSSNGCMDKTAQAPNPPTTTTPNFLFKPHLPDSDWPHPLRVSAHQSASSSSSGSTTVKSSENNSPAYKRVHLSSSTDGSPVRVQPSSTFSQQQTNGYTGAGPSVNQNVHSLFKMPQVCRRGQSYPHVTPTSSPVQSTHSNSSQGSSSSCQSSIKSNSSCQSVNISGFVRTQELSLQCDLPGGPTSGQQGTSKSGSTNKIESHSQGSQISPKPEAAPSASCHYEKSGNHLPGQSYQQSLGDKSEATIDRHVSQSSVSSKSAPQSAYGQQQQHAAFSQQQTAFSQQQTAFSQQQTAFSQQQTAFSQQHQQTAFNQQHQQTAFNQQQTAFNQQQQQQTAFNQHQRWAGPAQLQTSSCFFNKNHHQQSAVFPATNQQHVMARTMTHLPGAPHHPRIRTPVDSPLDQGYFSNESAGNCSNSSALSPAFTTSSVSSFSSICTMMPADGSGKFSQKSSIMQQQQQAPGSRISGHKSVSFADLPNGSPPSFSLNTAAMESKPQGHLNSEPLSDCAFETDKADSTSQSKCVPSGKMMPRVNYSSKSGVAPYTVPLGQAQGMPGPTTSLGYDMNSRTSCALTSSSDRCKIAEPSSELSHDNTGSAFIMDNNQNLTRMDSVHSNYPNFPPPLISPQLGDYVSMQSEPPCYSMEEFSSMHHSPSSHPLQPSHQMPSTEPMPVLPPHMQPPHQQPSLPFSSCCHSNTSRESDFSAAHVTNGGHANYQAPLAMSTPVSSRASSNTHVTRPYGAGHSFDAVYGHRVQPELYPTQNPHRSAAGHDQPVNCQQVMAHRVWTSCSKGPEELQVQVGNLQPNPGILQPPHSLPPSHPHSLPPVQQSPTPACVAPMAPGPPHMSNLEILNPGHGNPNMGPPHTHRNSHPEYGPCAGLPCHGCKMLLVSQRHQHLGTCSGPTCRVCPNNSHTAAPALPSMPHTGLCTGPSCTVCKVNQQAGRPQILSSQQKFIQHLIMDEGNSAYRSHPLFPLLRDLVIAEMNFDNPHFHYQQLLSLLPNDFHKLLNNFLHRNPPSGNYQSNEAVESVIMDSLRLAHSNLLNKIRHRQELEAIKGNSSASLRSMEEFCQKFDHSVNGPMQVRPIPNGNGSMTLGPQISVYHEAGYMQHHGVAHMYGSDCSDMYGEHILSSTSPGVNKTESKKHPSLPKEAVAMMMEWLRNHKDNPYPNDDEKAMLIKQTGLSINQINYWFTNARRRILPKWSQCKT